MTEQGASFIFPDAFAKFEAVIPVVERHDMISAYHRRLTSDDESVRLEAGRAWSIYEMETSRLYVDPDYVARARDDDEFCLQFARIESHYFVHGGFFESDAWILENAATALQVIPGVIVQGRYDVVCPAKTAWELHERWPRSRLEMIPDAGHSAKEPGIIDALVRATDEFRTQ
jgi:proline iminopeptidase